jgi:hypothetical protein
MNKFTLTLNTPIEDAVGNVNNAVHIEAGTHGIDYSSSETEDFVGFYGVPYKDAAAFASDKKPVRIDVLNPDRGYGRARGEQPHENYSFGFRLSSTEFTYAVEQSETTNKVCLTAASLTSFIEAVKVKIATKLGVDPSLVIS